MSGLTAQVELLAPRLHARARYIDFAQRGGDPTGSSQCGEALADAIADMSDWSALVIPPGDYDLSDIPSSTWWLQLAGNHRAIICPWGRARLNFGGKWGFRLMGSQEGWLFANLILSNTPRGIWSEDISTGGANTHYTRDFTFSGVDVRDFSGADRVYGVWLHARVRDIRVDRCGAHGLHSTNDNCIGWFLGGEYGAVSSDYDYGESGAVGSGYGSVVVTNFNARGITTAMANASNPLNHALRLYGYRVKVIGGAIEGVYSTVDTGASDSVGYHSAAIYCKTRQFAIQGVGFKDAGSHAHIMVKGEESETYGESGTGVVSGCTFRTQAIKPNAAIIYAYRPNALVTGNYFDRTEMANANGYAVRMRTAEGQAGYTYVDGFHVTKNIFREHKGRFALFGNDNCSFRLNKIIRPYGSTSTADEWNGVVFNRITTAVRDFSSVGFEDNEWFLGENFRSDAAVGSNNLYWLVASTVSSALGITGSITSGTRVLTVSDASGLAVGMAITIVGVTGSKVITAIDGTSVSLHKAADATVSGAAVSRTFMVNGLRIKDRVRGMSRLPAAERAKLRMVRHGPADEGHTDWDIDLDIDAEPNDVYRAIQFMTNGARRTRNSRLRCRYKYPLAVNAGMTSRDDVDDFVVLREDESGLVVTNEYATTVRTVKLPPGANGITFIFRRVAGQAMRVDPNGSQVIGAAAAGKYIELTSVGDVELEWEGDDQAGFWNIKRATATYTVEP